MKGAETMTDEKLETLQDSYELSLEGQAEVWFALWQELAEERNRVYWWQFGRKRWLDIELALAWRMYNLAYEAKQRQVDARRNKG